MASYLERPKLLLKCISKSLDKGDRRAQAIKVAKRFPNTKIVGNRIYIMSFEEMMFKKGKK